MKCMKKYADGGIGPGRRPKVNMPGKKTKKMHPSCKGGGCWSSDTSGPSNPDANRGQIAGKGPKVSFDNSRVVSQKELERRRKKKETAGMGVAERVRYNMNKRKNQKATKEATQLNRYAGPRFL